MRIESVHEKLGNASNILLLTPSMSSHEDEACFELLTPVDPSKEDVLTINFTRSVEEWIDNWEQYIDGTPSKKAIVNVGQTNHTTATQSIELDETSSIIIDAVREPGNLTQLGIAITERLGKWDSDENQSVICFHSLTPLLQYVDTKRVFRFLHTLSGHVKTTGSMAHYHLDSRAHNGRTVSALTPVFDAIVEIDEDGACSIRSQSID